jgi:nucleoside-diphosphate-sugar epimerase
LQRRKKFFLTQIESTNPRKSGRFRVGFATCAKITNQRKTAASLGARILPHVPRHDDHGLSKLSAEALCAYYRNVLGLDVICLRGATAYGPFKRGAGLSPPGLIGAALERTALRATYSESAYRVVVDEYVYNADIGRAVALAVAAPRTTRLLFNIGTGVGLTTEALGFVTGFDVEAGLAHALTILQSQ